MLITSATTQEIPKSFGINSGARVPSPNAPSAKNVRVDPQGQTDKSPDPLQQTSLNKVEEPRGESVEKDSVLKSVSDEETLREPQGKINDQSIRQEEEVDQKELAELADYLNTQVSENLRIKFLTDENTGINYFQLIEKETGEVIRQYPPDEMLKLADQLQYASSLIFSGQA